MVEDMDWSEVKVRSVEPPAHPLRFDGGRSLCFLRGKRTQTPSHPRSTGVLDILVLEVALTFAHELAGEVVVHATRPTDQCRSTTVRRNKRVGFASGSARSRRPQFGPRLRASRE